MFSTEHNVAHHFDLSGMKAGDQFFGCEKCWHQRLPNRLSYPECPICQSRMFLFTVKDDDVIDHRVWKDSE